MGNLYLPVTLGEGVLFYNKGVHVGCLKHIFLLFYLFFDYLGIIITQIIEPRRKLEMKCNNFIF
jgi:hypothetical protein